jgi:hypothetical protein
VDARRSGGGGGAGRGSNGRQRTIVVEREGAALGTVVEDAVSDCATKVWEAGKNPESIAQIGEA